MYLVYLVYSGFGCTLHFPHSSCAVAKDYAAKDDKDGERQECHDEKVFAFQLLVRAWWWDVGCGGEGEGACDGGGVGWWVQDVNVENVVGVHGWGVGWSVAELDGD